MQRIKKLYRDVLEELNWKYVTGPDDAKRIVECGKLESTALADTRCERTPCILYGNEENIVVRIRKTTLKAYGRGDAWNAKKITMTFGLTRLVLRHENLMLKKSSSSN